MLRSVSLTAVAVVAVAVSASGGVGATVTPTSSPLWNETASLAVAEAVAANVLPDLLGIL